MHLTKLASVGVHIRTNVGKRQIPPRTTLLHPVWKQTASTHSVPTKKDRCTLFAVVATTFVQDNVGIWKPLQRLTRGCRTTLLYTCVDGNPPLQDKYFRIEATAGIPTFAMHGRKWCIEWMLLISEEDETLPKD
jgi:hypothetical protein